MPTDAGMVDLFKRELELCKVTPEETLAVLTQGEGYADWQPHN